MTWGGKLFLIADMEREFHFLERRQRVMRSTGWGADRIISKNQKITMDNMRKVRVNGGLERTIKKF